MPWRGPLGSGGIRSCRGAGHLPGVDMNTFEVAVRVGHMLYGDMVGITALVDTGATDTVLPTSFLHELGVQPDMKVQVAYANGEIR
jgi:predicted aspartyl protease